MPAGVRALFALPCNELPCRAHSILQQRRRVCGTLQHFRVNPDAMATPGENLGSFGAEFGGSEVFTEVLIQ